jgi:hypothetical protein
MSDVRDRSPRPLYQLQSDAKAGLKTAVGNGQIRLAIEYAQVVIAEQQDEIKALRLDLDELKGVVSELARSASGGGEPARGRKPAADKEEAPAPTQG